MENLIGVELKKKQLSWVFPNADTTKTGGAWDSEFKRIQTLGDVEKVEGKRAYIVHKIYDSPKELLHGNKGKEAWNKGAHDPTSLKYQLAEILIKLNSVALTKSGYLKELGLNGNNLEHFHTMFKSARYNELKLMDKFAYSEVIGIETALGRLALTAIDLIKDGVFPNVTVEEMQWVNINGKHREADDWEMFYSIYQKARKLAEEVVEQKYGKNLFFAKKMKLITTQYEIIIAQNEEFSALKSIGIKYFYERYLIKNNNMPNEVPLYDEDGENIIQVNDNSQSIKSFVQKFIQHRLTNAENNIEKLLAQNPELAEGFNSKETTVQFANKLIPLLLGNNSYNAFEENYKQITVEPNKLSDSFVKSIEEALPF